MLLESLRQQVLRANQEIARRGLAPHTFGNASGVDRSGPKPLVVIKPSGVDYAALTLGRSWSSQISMARSSKARCALRAISIRTRCSTASFRKSEALFIRTPNLQRRGPRRTGPIPCLGTTHADYFHGPVPVTQPLSAEEVASGYVRNTGAVIVRCFRSGDLDPVAIPGVLVAGHAPFAWGKDPAEAVEHADVLEYIARLAFRSVLLGAPEAGIPAHVSEYHYLRKHGSKATYGQR